MELERETEIILPATVKLYVSRTIDPDEVISVKLEEFRKAPKELVRCKDCKHWDADEHVCNIKIGWFSCDADWFCADGDRR